MKLKELSENHQKGYELMEDSGSVLKEGQVFGLLTDFAIAASMPRSSKYRTKKDAFMVKLKQGSAIYLPVFLKV